MRYGFAVQLFTLPEHRRVAAGEYRVTFRLWKSAHVKKGAVYPTGFDGAYRIDDVRVVRAGDLTDADAWASGSPDVAALFKIVGAHTKTKITKATKLYRVELTYLPEPPPKKALSVDEIVKRLARFDRDRPWTRTALALIARHPRVLARELAAEAGIPTPIFKVDVRKLKRLGLTTSHVRGYELTALGQEVLDRLPERV